SARSLILTADHGDVRNVAPYWSTELQVRNDVVAALSQSRHRLDTGPPRGRIGTEQRLCADPTGPLVSSLAPGRTPAPATGSPHEPVPSPPRRGRRRRGIRPGRRPRRRPAACRGPRRGAGRTGPLPRDRRGGRAAGLLR